MIERQIIIGLIISTEYIKRIRAVFDVKYLESSSARTIANWIIPYYDKYGKAPKKKIETIFYKKLDEGLNEEIGEEFELEILPDLSEEYENKDFDLEYLIDETFTYIKSRSYLKLSEEIDVLITEKKGDLKERIEQVENITNNFKPIHIELDESVDLSHRDSLENVRKAFEEGTDPVLKFPKQLGQFWNDQFVPGAFIVILAIEKRGKTWWLLYFAKIAARHNIEVALFQAGDMNEGEQLKRIGINLTKRSNLKKYCTEHYEPVRDCLLNQLDKCDKEERECDFGIFDDLSIKELKEIEMEQLIEAYTYNKDYEPCYNCSLYDSGKLGTPWLKLNKAVEPLDSFGAIKAYKQYFIKNKRKFKISTHANGTLTFSKMNMILDGWESEGFIPRVILMDYMDIAATEGQGDWRQLENNKWKDARKLSQTERGGILPLFISPTQANALAYKKRRLTLDNFSEDKRKNAHPTAMYALNQDPLGRMKKIGIMGIGEVILREGEFSIDNEITILQNLRQGQPCKGSYF